MPYVSLDELERRDGLAHLSLLILQLRHRSGTMTFSDDARTVRRAIKLPKPRDHRLNPPILQANAGCPGTQLPSEEAPRNRAHSFENIAPSTVARGDLRLDPVTTMS